MAGLNKSTPVAGVIPSQSERGRGARGAAVRVLGVLLLALGIGLGYVGVMSGAYGPLLNATQGAMTVDYCTHHDAKKSNGSKCHGSFAASEGSQTAAVAVVDTDDSYAKGQQIDVVQVGGNQYFRSVADAVASGLRYLFGGLCAIGPALFCLITGRWPSPGSAGVLRSMNPAFSWLTFPLVGLGLLGLVITSLIVWAI